MLPETLGGSIHHPPWCAGHKQGDTAMLRCMRTVEIAGVRVTLSQGSTGVELATVCPDGAPLTAAQLGTWAPSRSGLGLSWLCTTRI
jgi:hypothetical protein